MSHHRLFAQLAFERALGNPAIEALQSALDDKDHYDAESIWPKDPMFHGVTSAEIAAISAELEQIVEDRLRDVVNGPGFANIERGERFYAPEIVRMVMEARDRLLSAPA